MVGATVAAVSAVAVTTVKTAGKVTVATGRVASGQALHEGDVVELRR